MPKANQLEQPDFKDKAEVPNDNKLVTIKEEALKWISNKLWRILNTRKI